MVIKNRKKIIFVGIVFIIILGITLLILNKTGAINRIINNTKQEEIKKEISCEVYHHVDGKTAILVIAEDTENGIAKIIYPNNEMELYCNGKNKVAFDYNTDITGKESITFKAINTIGEEIEKTIVINEQFYLDLINYNFTTETETQKALTVNYKEGSITKQYKIGEVGNWIDYTGRIRLDDYQILETLGEENREIKVSLRQVDRIGNEIISPIKYTIEGTYKKQDTIIEGESILACIENKKVQESGNYIFKVTGTAKEENPEGVIETKTETIEYPVELYNYDGNANYITNNIGIISEKTYTGMGKISSEKRMLILKYNGDLTIDEGVTITPTGTDEIINGATYLCTKKGMFIYCAGTLTNNGEITMTAKGTVNEEGENVYLYKNEDNTYEYIPAVGGLGGASVSEIQAGKPGVTGIERRTGGGGSGGCFQAKAGKGGNGTSYSGGTGGGGVWRNQAYGTGDINGSSMGGVGGAAGTSYDGNSGYHSAGGAGNPGGTGIGRRNGRIGTGGLLIITTNSIKNNGIITSNGSNGGTGASYAPGGGASGGGSINIFYKSNIAKGIININGGAGGRGGSSYFNGNGGNGGNGSITIGNIYTGTFVKDE